MRHARFHTGFIWLALLVAMGVGFSIGAHLSFVMGFGMRLGRGFATFVQLHGHVQLAGWAGLFIMGISLHFLPRLAGMPLDRPHWPRRILWFMGLGLVLRAVTHSMIPYLTTTSAFVPVMLVVVGTGILEAIGIFYYVSALASIIRHVHGDRLREALRSIRPFVGMMLVGWLLYASATVLLLVHMAINKWVVVHQGWNQFAIEGYIGLVLIPVTFAISIRTFPLYLRLSTPDWSVRGAAYAYLVALVIRLAPMIPPLQQLAPQLSDFVRAVGTCLRSATILWFLWQLDVLTRMKPPWTVNRKLHPGPERRDTRPGLPDYGEFGRFERLIYAAYVWLAVAATAELILGVCHLVGAGWLIGHNATRHMFLAGFVNLLIFGMAVRMIPGFIQKRRVASPALVDATFWLGNVAAGCRVLPFVLPTSLLERVPGIHWGARIAFGLSGIIGLIAVLCLAMNLWNTARMSGARPEAA